MKTITELVLMVREKYLDEAEFKYLYPTLYIVCMDAQFARMEPEERELMFTERLNLNANDLEKLRSIGLIEICLITPSERVKEYGFLDTEDGGHHWLERFNPLLWKNDRPLLQRSQPSDHLAKVTAVHFYGYKGGQARSTVLALMAKTLADSGQKVLVVDADVEAPSLDSMLGVAADLPEATLMGLCGWSDQISPISRAYVGRVSEGSVDVLACRPRTPNFDMDYAAFVLGTALDARSLQRATSKLRSFAENGKGLPKYDVVLFDHRTGITSSVLPIMGAWPGPAVVFVRPDGMTRHAEIARVFDTLLAHDRSTPGAFVSFSLDPKETSQQAREIHGKFVDQLLSTLSDTMTRGTELDDIDPIELEESWVFWHHDRALLGTTIPAPIDLSSANQKSLAQLIDVLGLRDIRPEPVAPNLQPQLTRSGASDEGWFILTPDIARLFSPSSSLLYVFGRKGTGKTRLVRELQTQSLGEPLLVAADYADGGLPSGSAAFQTLYKACGSDMEVFWWALLRTALESDNTRGNALQERINSLCADGSLIDISTYGTARAVEEALRALPGKRIFLIDGVETAVPASALRGFVEVLFRFMSTIQYSRNISQKLTVRLFLRSDLARGASQNVEQQIEGNEIYLRWDKTAILNFALGRMASLPWFNSQFPTVCEGIQKQKELVAKGALSDEAAEALLLEVFPKSLERNKLKTTTFFSTYFSDAGGESEGKASFYPRLFDGFLRDINEKAMQTNPSRPVIEGNRLSSRFVLQAYDEASGRFIEEVRTEFYALLDFESLANKNQQAVDRFFEAFSGQKTPFVLDDIERVLADRSNLPANVVREALRNMKAMGIFEDRPGFPGSWRTGRLYKSGLKMKYVRG